MASSLLSSFVHPSASILPGGVTYAPQHGVGRSTDPKDTEARAWTSSTGCWTPTPRSAGRSCGTSPHEPERVVAAERARVATEGWGARLLALQGDDGRWGGSAWSHDWTDTMHTLELLRLLGLDPASDAGPAGDRPRARPRHLGGRVPDGRLGRQRVLRRRGRAVHQRRRRRDRRLLRPGRPRLGGPAARRAARRRRLELRGGERRDGVVVRDHDPGPRRPAGVRAGDARSGARSGPLASAGRSTCWSGACSVASRRAR